MGGFFGTISKRDCVMDVFFGTDYHSHLGTKRGGMAVYDAETGFQRQIHNIENTPFRTKFDNRYTYSHGCAGIGCISDTDPQPLIVRSHLGLYAIITVGIITNTDELVERYFSERGHQFMAMSSARSTPPSWPPPSSIRRRTWSAASATPRRRLTAPAPC